MGGGGETVPAAVNVFDAVISPSCLLISTGDILSLLHEQNPWILECGCHCLILGVPANTGIHHREAFHSITEAPCGGCEGQRWEPRE